VACSFPQRVWWVPATLLLPQQVSKNVHFKIGVRGSLEDGKVMSACISNVPHEDLLVSGSTILKHR
jgi:hypothetical protein